MDPPDEPGDEECDQIKTMAKRSNGSLRSGGSDVMLDNFLNMNDKSKGGEECNIMVTPVSTPEFIRNHGIKIVIDGVDDSPSEIENSPDDRKVSTRQRRSGVSMCTGPLDLVMDNPIEKRSQVNSDDSSSIDSNGLSFEVRSSRKSSYDADSETATSINDSGYVNKGFEDNFLDNVSLEVQRIMKSASADNLRPENNNRTEKKRKISFEEPIKPAAQNGAHPRRVRRYEPDGGMETDISEESVDFDGDTLASHVRKDSIALWSERFGELKAFQKRYKAQQNKKNRFNPMRHLKSVPWKKYKLHAVVVAMFLTTLILLSVVWHYQSQLDKMKTDNRKIIFELKSRRLHLIDAHQADDFVGSLGQSIPSWKLPVHCSPETETADRTCIEWREYARLQISYFDIHESKCLNVSWESFVPMLFLKDCYDLGTATWYGPANISGTQWPLFGANFTFSPSRIEQPIFGSFNTAMEYYWLSSNAVVVRVDNDAPLTVDWNSTSSGHMCFIANFTDRPYGNTGGSGRYLNYTICNGVNMLDTHRNISGEFSGKLENYPAKNMFAYPHWSTKWQSGASLITVDHVMDLTSQIRDSKLNCSTIELDGKWEHAYGDFSFDRDRFENISAMLQTMNDMNCGLSVQVHPYIHYRSDNFKECLQKQYLIEDTDRNVPSLIEWGAGLGGILDITNENARDWVEDKIKNLHKDYDLDVMLFNLGDTAWFPYQPKFSNPRISPSVMHSMYTELASSFSGDVIIQAVSRGQHLPVFISLPTRIVKADGQTCLSNLITNAFVLGLLGYPFVISDGFITKDYTSMSDMPSRDLYMRWMQLSAFFPAVKFSITPWSYDVDVVKMANNVQSLRDDVQQIIMKMKGDVMNGEPIIRPLWWHNPKDSIAQKINDEFLIGEDMMVAPILCEGTLKRNIYVPGGIWSDELRGNLVIGGDWLNNYEVSLYEIPRFRKMSVVGETDKANIQK
ncbi:hypothetical protein ScPMuIL_008303 [Solemya velum]